MKKFRQLLLYLMLLGFVCSALGCDAFTRKFTREKKHTDIIEPVLTPDDNAGLFYDNDTKYKNYFAYWRAWQDELIQSVPQESRKRRRYCFAQVVENLELMADLLKDEHQKELRDYIARMEKFRDSLDTIDVINQRIMTQEFSNIRLSINSKLHYSRVKDWIKK